MDDANRLFLASRPRSRHAHWYRTDDGAQLLVANGNRVFQVAEELVTELEAAVEAGDPAVEALLIDLGIRAPDFVDDTPIKSPPLYALSLAVAQKCNLGCTYCYANQGAFGGPARSMSLETAQRAVELLVSQAAPGSRINLAFLGGEPLVNRAVLRAATQHAAECAAARGVSTTFSITTNGTLLTEDDAVFFERYGFAVTVSLDGLGEVHDRSRPLKRGGGTFDLIMERVQPLLSMQREMQVSVRSTVTPGNVRLRESLDYFLAAGFHSVGFSPVLRSPTGSGELNSHDLAPLLDAMVGCGKKFEDRVLQGERYGFANMVNAMRELHRGTHRPYPCGAGAGYLGVSADGDLAACHRFVGDSEGAMGNLMVGIDREAQNRWLADRHVHNQTACRECWARYLCGGGCHHEVIGRGRTACDYIRGWLHYCLEAYGRLSSRVPDWFGNPSGARNA